MKLTSLLAIGALTCSAMTAVAEEAAQGSAQGSVQGATQDAATGSPAGPPMAMGKSGKNCDHKKKMHGMKAGDRGQMMGHGMGPMMGHGMHPGPRYGQYPGAGPRGYMAGPWDPPYETTMSPPRGMMGHGPRPMMERGMGPGMGQGMGQGMGPGAMGQRLEAVENHLANIEKLLQKMLDLQQKQ